jgi:hypothetical protein
MQYSENKDIEIGVVTWNLAGNSPHPNFDISNILLMDPKTNQMKTPDILIVAFQEMVKLNVQQIVKGKDIQ